jgi:mRNA interferase RelE/StbE
MSERSQPYELFIEHGPLKYLERLRRKDAAGIDRDLKELAKDPLKKAGVVAMKGQVKGEFRMRCGQYRVIFRKDDEARLIVVTEIGPRGDVYKKGR